MRETILLFVGLCLATAASGQSRFGYGISVFPNYSNARLIAFDNLSEEQVIRITNNETWKFSYTGGVFANWRSEKLGFQLGLNYMNSGYQTIRDSIPFDQPNPNNADDWRMIYQSTYIELPMDIQFYQEVSDTDEFFFMFGATASYNINNKIETVYYFGDSQSSEIESQDNNNYNGFNLGFQSALGWEKSFSEQYAMVVQPTFQYWFRGMLKDNSLNRSLFSLGLRVAFKIKQQSDY
ncbi:MAG: PorT family protein [Saprospiraceae bacterium]|jgi:hypothetical protein|nr:PorT family protein [Saprospiraceae bacterium]